MHHASFSSATFPMPLFLLSLAVMFGGTGAIFSAPVSTYYYYPEYILLLESIHAVDPSLRVAYVSLSLDGRTTGTCSSCDAPFMRPMTHYQYYNSGEGGERSFADPLPQGNLLKSINVTLVGCFHCLLSSPSAVVSLDIGSTVVQSEYTLPPGPDLCQCMNCHYATSIPGADVGSTWWPGWTYGGNNRIRMFLLRNAITLSFVNLTLTAMDVTPNITSVLPLSAPLAADESSRAITIRASNLYADDFRYKCVFSRGAYTAVSTATEVNATAMRCLLPSVDTPTALNITFYPDVSAWGNVSFPNNSIGPFPFSFYVAPTVSYIFPTSSSALGGVNITVFGTGFFAAEALACKLGPLLVPAALINSTAITCFVPPGTGTVEVFVTENGVDFSGDGTVTFTYKSTSSLPWSDLTPAHRAGISVVIIVVAVSVVVVLAVASVGYLLYQKYIRSRGESPFDDIADFDSRAIIDASELEMKERIGRGSFGDVYRARWRHTEVAVKKIPAITEALFAELIQEARLMLSLRHPNVVQFMGVCTTTPDIGLVTEYVSRGSLYEILHNAAIVLEPEHIRRLALDTCKGLAYLHAARVIHRDLKSHNLLVDKHWTVKVGDFGLSRALDQTAATMTACGTPCWTAPEVLKNQRYTVKADVYSFGVCMWELVTRDDPFVGLPPYAVVLAVATKGERPEPPADYLHPVFEQIITECFNEEPEKRPSCDELVSLLDSLVLASSSPHPIELKTPVTSSRAPYLNSPRLNPPSTPPRSPQAHASLPSTPYSRHKGCSSPPSPLKETSPLL